MKLLFINGSPRKKGTVVHLLKIIKEEIDENRHETEWIDVYDLQMKPCIGCMTCRTTNECILSEDDAHKVGDKIEWADAIIVGTPTHWGNMSAQLKLLFDRNVPVFMGEKPNGIPTPRQKGKLAAVVTACTTPWPFNVIFAESRGAVRAVKEVLHYGGYTYLGAVVKPGTKKQPQLSHGIKTKAKKMGQQLNCQ